jgi:hypothetical protein
LIEVGTRPSITLDIVSQNDGEIAPYVRNLGRLTQAWSATADADGQDTGSGGEVAPDQCKSVDWELVRVRIAAIDAEAAAYLRATRPASTSRAYAGDWKAWTPFCARMGLPELMFSPGLLTAFAVHLWHGDPQTGLAPAAPSTIRRRISGVVVTLRDHGVAVPRGAAEPAYTAVDRLEREHAQASEQPRGRGKAAALGVTHLQLICRELPDTLAGTRDKAILLLGFASAPAAARWPTCSSPTSPWRNAACWPTADGARPAGKRPSPCPTASTALPARSARGLTGNRPLA